MVSIKKTYISSHPNCIASRRILNDWKVGCLPSLLILASRFVLLVFVIWQLSRWVIINWGKHKLLCSPNSVQVFLKTNRQSWDSNSRTQNVLDLQSIHRLNHSTTPSALNSFVGKLNRTIKIWSKDMLCFKYNNFLLKIKKAIKSSHRSIKNSFEVFGK